jgi:hypothetical protein
MGVVLLGGQQFDDNALRNHIKPAVAGQSLPASPTGGSVINSARDFIPSRHRFGPIKLLLREPFIQFSLIFSLPQESQNFALFLNEMCRGDEWHRIKTQCIVT